MKRSALAIAVCLVVLGLAPTTAFAATPTTLSCIPEEMSHSVVWSVDVWCTLTDEHNVVIAEPSVWFDVTQGPGASATGITACIAEESSARCTIPSARVLGSDRVVMWVNLTQLPGYPVPTQSYDMNEPLDTSTITWQVGTPRIIDCSPEANTGPVDTKYDIACNVSDGMGNRVPDSPVSWITEGMAELEYSEAFTDQNGTARATVASSVPGAATVIGDINPTASYSVECRSPAGHPAGAPEGVCRDSVAVSWIAGNDASASVDNTGGTLATSNFDSPTESAPVGTSVAVPEGTEGGTVSVQTSDTVTTPADPGYTMLGQQIQIEAPLATWDNPLVLGFTLDASLVQGFSPATLDLYRDGVALADCPAGSTTALAPDATHPDGSPCVSDRTVLESGDFRFVVLTPHASTWNFAAPTDPLTWAELCDLTKQSLQGTSPAAASRLATSLCSKLSAAQKSGSSKSRVRAVDSYVSQIAANTPAFFSEIEATRLIRLAYSLIS